MTWALAPERVASPQRTVLAKPLGARRATSGLGAAVAPSLELDPSRSQAQAVAATLLRGLH
jgi:hypothetical protein